jgi:hypothetical protein
MNKSELIDAIAADGITAAKLALIVLGNVGETLKKGGSIS